MPPEAFMTCPRKKPTAACIFLGLPMASRTAGSVGVVVIVRMSPTANAVAENPDSVRTPLVLMDSDIRGLREAMTGILPEDVLRLVAVERLDHRVTGLPDG